MLTRSNRTFICSVAFLDVVEYSRKPVAEQIQLREQLNALLAEALKDVAANDRVILDTGDGAAISFVGDPEDALFVSMALRDAVTGPRPDSPMPLRLRIGINLGPVRLVRDLNGQPNIIGDGINVAQRVMGFSLPNQILVSRSYYEVVSRLSEPYARLFRYEGSRTDKHVREHEVYAVGSSTGEIRRMHEAAHATTTGLLSGLGIAQTVIGSLSQSARQVTDNLRTRPRLDTALAVVAILVTAIVLRGLREKPEAQVAEGAPEAPATTAPAAITPAVTPPQEQVAAAPPPSLAKSVPEPKPAAPADEPGIIAFAITPWGEIYVDDKKQGVSPPLQEVQVGPGRHKVEVRNTTFTPYVQTVEVKRGERIRIRHRFR